MSKYVIAVNKEEFLMLNQYEAFTLKRKVGRKSPLTYTRKPREVFIALRNGGKKDRLLFVRDVAEIDNFDEIRDNFKESELTYTRAEEIIVNGMIPATATLVKVDTKKGEITIKDLMILGQPKTLKELGLQRVPKVFTRVK